MNSVEIAEAFHLAYLNVLGASLDARAFALKGGGNLRFFFDSLRYSEDIDLDVLAPDHRTVSERIERAFASPALAKLLASLGLQVTRLNPADRTATKERWKIGITPVRGGLETATKVEFSYRDYGRQEEYVTVEAMPGRAVAPYAPIPAPVIGHYLPRGAVIQKISALDDRRHTQPRDVFDLDHLFRKFPDAPARDLVPVQALDGAMARVFELSYPEYLSKVVTFLDPAIAPAFESEDAWGRMQVRVVEVLERMR